MRNSVFRSIARLRSIARKAAAESKIVLPASVATSEGTFLSAIAAVSARDSRRSLYTPLAFAVPALASAAYLASDYASAAEIERTFIAIKPDGVQRGLISEIIAHFERKGYKLVGLKLLAPTKEFAEKHYSDLSTKPFFNSLTDFLSSGPVVAMVWEGPGVVKYGRKMIGATNPLASEPGTIRGDYAIAIGRNVIHGSDSVETAVNEIALWFEPKELVDYHLDAHKWVYES